MFKFLYSKYFRSSFFNTKPSLYLGRTLFACGIIGYVGDDCSYSYLIEGLESLRSRGYDSAGISTIENENSKIIIKTSKYSSSNTSSDSFDILKEKTMNQHSNNTIGIGHTRWATHGGKLDINAHPHNNTNNTISLVHNGTLENSRELKNELISKGIKFKSETDTEVIVQLISYFYNNQKSKNINAAIKEALYRLQGTYGLAIICKDFPDQIIAVRNGSPLIIGIGKDKMWLASEYSAFSRHTKSYISLRDREITIITKSNLSIDTNGRLAKAPEEVIAKTPSPYKYWTIKEIMEQPETIENALNHGGRFVDENFVKLGGLNKQKKTVLDIQHLIITACGSSCYASQLGAKVMRVLKSFETVQVVDASEFNTYLLPKEKGGLLAVSQSGETKDVIRAVNLALFSNIFVFSVVNRISSEIAILTNCGVYCNAGKEFAVASTKTFIAQTICIILIAIWKCQNQNNFKVDSKSASIISSLQNLQIYSKVILNNREKYKKIAKEIYKSDHMFILGKGLAEPIAYEGALKFKEITYIHSEGYSGGALKHGPFALIEKGMPIFLIVLNDEHCGLMKITCEELLSREANVYVITSNERQFSTMKNVECIRIPENGYITALLAIVPLQIIAYEVALLKGINPDKPRNLAKSVTVD